MQGQTSVAGEGKHDLDPTRQSFGVHRGPQRPIERQPNRSRSLVEGKALLDLQLLGLLHAEGARVDLQMQRPARRHRKVEIDAVNVRAIAGNIPEAARNAANGVMRRRFDQVEVGPSDRWYWRSHGIVRVDPSDHIGDVAPLGIALEEQLGRQARARLADVVENNDAAGPHQPRGAFEIETGELELVGRAAHSRSKRANSNSWLPSMNTRS